MTIDKAMELGTIVTIGACQERGILSVRTRDGLIITEEIPHKRSLIRKWRKLLNSRQA